LLKSLIFLFQPKHVKESGAKDRIGDALGHRPDGCVVRIGEIVWD